MLFWWGGYNSRAVIASARTVPIYTFFDSLITENLATEVESWQNQKRLRDLDLPLSQKKSLRLQYEKCPKIKLTRLRAMKFACKRMGHWWCRLRRTVCQRLTGWSKPLVCVDRHRGGEMFTALQLHKVMVFVCFNGRPGETNRDCNPWEESVP